MTDPEQCKPEDCIYKQFSKNMENSAKHDKMIITEYQNNLKKVIAELVDNGFKNPIITLEAVVSYLENPTVKGHPEKQGVYR